MKTSLCLKASSFSYPADICVPDDLSPMLPTSTGWRAQSRACVLANGQNTGYVHIPTLEEYNLTTGVVTGNTKPNVPSDANYIADYQDTNLCALPSQNQNVSLTVGFAQTTGNTFAYIATLSQALSVPIIINLSAIYRQNGIDKNPAPPAITIPAGQTSVNLNNGAYDPALGAITNYSTHITLVIPPSPDAKTLVLVDYNSAGGAIN